MRHVPSKHVRFVHLGAARVDQRLNMAAVLVGGVKSWAGDIASLSVGSMAWSVSLDSEGLPVGKVFEGRVATWNAATAARAMGTHEAAEVVACVLVVAGVFLRVWMEAAAVVVVNDLAVRMDRKAFVAGRLRSIMGGAVCADDGGGRGEVQRSREKKPQ
jgi:hypothetical protein